MQMLQMLGDKGSVERRLFALVLVTVLGLALVGGAGYVGAVTMRNQSVRAAQLQQALGMQQDADMVHDMLRSDVLVAVRVAPARRRDVAAVTRRHRDRAVRDMRASSSLLARAHVSRRLGRQARSAAVALRHYADQAVDVASAPPGQNPERPRLWDAFDRQRANMAALTDAIQAELSSAHDAAVTTSRRLTMITATVAVTVLVVLLGLAVRIVRGVRRILRAKTRAENEQARQNVALRQQATALIEADRVKGRLLAVTSHEIRGALSATIVAVRTAQRLTELGTAGQLRPSLRLAERHAEHVLSVVVDALGDQRSSGPQVPQRASELFEVAQLAADAAERHKKGHRLQLEIAPIACDVDANRLQQMLRNLIENAYKYTPEGCHVLVRATSEPHHLVITVADDGPGLPTNLTETMLQPFQRGPHPAGAEGGGPEGSGPEGSGLGLFVVNELVQAMQGTLDVDSRPGAGTTFTLRLPCTHEYAGSPDQPLVSAAPEADR